MRTVRRQEIGRPDTHRCGYDGPVDRIPPRAMAISFGVAGRTLSAQHLYLFTGRMVGAVQGG
jgi:hypothetical protein